MNKTFNDGITIGELLTIPTSGDIANIQLPDPELLQYYKDDKERVYWIDSEIGADTLDLAKIIMRHNCADISLSVEDRLPIKIFIDSPGGDVQTMWTLVNAIKISKTPVYTITYCNAMSAAAHILAAGHKRFAFPGSTILVHSGSCQFGGDMEKVESAKKYFDALGKKANDMLLNDTKIQAKDLKRKGANDWYISDEEALKLGIVDAIVKDFTEVFNLGKS